MRSLFSADLLALWEQGSTLHPLDRGLAVLHAALADTAYEDLADWPLGRRNQALTEFRYSCFGPHMEAWTACPLCGEKLEFQMDARVLSAPNAPVVSQIIVNGQAFRLPTSRDLAQVYREADPQIAAVAILKACHLNGGLDARSDSPTWSEQDVEEVGNQMAIADPMAEMSVSIDCPGCAHEWEEVLDITAYLWTEIAAHAKRLLRDIHTLASTYGWSEREIVALSDSRRTAYLGMCQT